MQAIRKALVSTAGVGALLAVIGATPAEAALINFTWNPTGSSPQLSTDAGSEIVNANDLTIADYADIVVTQTGANTATATESAILNVTGANFNGTHVNTADLGVSSDPSPYQLYFSITANVTATGSAGVYNGYFTSITYSLIGATGTTCNFGAVLGAVSGCGTTTTLATGTLVPGQVSGNVSGATNYVATTPEPSAGAIVNIATAAGENGFFVAPPGATLGGFEFITDFTNNRSNITILSLNSDGEHFTINGGGGNINLLAVPVPEPLTISLFGAGLAGAAALRRRRSKKA